METSDGLTSVEVSGALLSRMLVSALRHPDCFWVDGYKVEHPLASTGTDHLLDSVDFKISVNAGGVMNTIDIADVGNALMLMATKRPLMMQQISEGHPSRLCADLFLQFCTFGEIHYD